MGARLYYSRWWQLIPDPADVRLAELQRTIDQMPPLVLPGEYTHIVNRTAADPAQTEPPR